MHIKNPTASFAKLPCETLMSAKQAINDKLQGSVARYLRCGGLVNDQIKNGLLLSLRVKKLKSVNIWQSYKQERDCLEHFVRLANSLLKDEESARDNHVLACSSAKYSPISIFSPADSGQSQTQSTHTQTRSSQYSAISK